MTDDLKTEKATAAAWFRQLRDDIVSAFEALEDSHAQGPLSDAPRDDSRSAKPRARLTMAPTRAAD